MEGVDRLTTDGLAIFLFHGVVRQSRYAVRNYTGKHMERDRFYRIVEGLKHAGSALSMDDVVEHCRSGNPFPPRAFAVTFDDGFENNYLIAAPILKEFSVPATFYITTGFVQDNAMSWIDRIEYCLEAVSSGVLQFAWDDHPHSFANVEDKIGLLQMVRDRVKTDPTLDPENVVQAVFEQCGLAAVCDSAEPIDQKMSWEQVTRLANDELFTVGGHSHSHKILSFLSAEELEDEITTSIDLIRKNVGLCVRHYSYPEGLEHCYSNEVVEVLRGKGVVCCPTAVDGINDPQTDLFHLRRIMIT